MIEDVFVANPVAHALNLAPSNARNRFGEALIEANWKFHSTWAPVNEQMPKELFTSDWSAEGLATTIFRETSIDVAATHYLRLDSWFYDGLVSWDKNVELAARWPNRFFVYLGVDPTVGTQACLEDLRRQHEQIPDAVGLKLYPHRVDPFVAWRMDDEELMFPIFEMARDIGLKTIAVHKAVPNGPVPMNPYRVDDVDGAAIAFPDLNFEIVH